MHCTTPDIDGELILDEENVKELYKLYKNLNDPKDIETIYVQGNSSSDSDDGILSMEVNPLFQKKYENLWDFNLLKKENYKKLLREIKLKKNKDKIIIDLTKDKDEEIIKLKFSKTLNKKMKRPISRIDTHEIKVNLIGGESSKSIHREIIPDFFNKITSIENLFLLNKDVRYDGSNQNQTVSILSYNILSQQFIKKRKINKELYLPSRMSTIIDQLKLISSDILCLQEVDTKSLNQHLIKNMKNYCFIYAQTYGSYFNNVIAFKTEKFVLIERENLNLKGINIKGNRSVFKMILEVKSNKTKIVVYNIHLPWKPEYIYHKFEILGLVAADVLRTGQKHVIIAGDFNSTPDSILLKLLHDKFFIDERIRNICVRNTNSDGTTKQNINPNIDRSFHVFTEDYSDNDSYDKDNYDSDVLDQDQKRRIENNSEIFKHFSRLISQYAFKSAYEDYKSLNLPRNYAIDRRNITKFENNHPEFTYYTENFRNTINYIFFSKTMELKKILKIPSREQVSTEGFLPSSKFPSDHLMTYAQLELKN